MNKTPSPLLKCAALLATSLLLHFSGLAQTTATWNGGGGDGLWNTGANWDTTIVPGDGTNAVIAAGNTVAYSSPMTAGDFGNLTLSGVLNVNASGFVLASNGVAALVSGATARLFVNNGGVMSVTNGNLTLTTSAAGSVAAGGSLTVNGTIGLGSSSTTIGYLTNNGGTISANFVRINPNNAASSALCLINGGTSSLGNVTIFRSGSGSAAFQALGAEGLVISNGVVNLASVVVGAPNANSSLTMQVAGGIVTNTGNFIVGQITGANSRPGRYVQNGGLVVSTIADGIRIGVSNSTQIVWANVLGGTNIAERFVLGDATNGAVAVTANLTNAANIYLGSGGIVTNVVNTFNVVLNSGGLFGAKADWASSLPMQLLSGTVTFNAADIDGTAHNITLSGVLRGGATVMNKNGAGTLTLNATNTYTGNTAINAGTLAIGANGAIATSPQISITAGATLDVSAKAGFSLTSAQTLGGNGTVAGAITLPSGATLNPGTSIGRLTFSSDLTEVGSASGVLNNFELSAATNDTVSVLGTLNLSNTNTVSIVALGGSLPGGIYKLFSYGSLVGGITNLTIGSTPGFLTNDTVNKAILLSTTGIRGPTNIVWVGSVGPNWDILTSVNWQKQIDASSEVFAQGDTVLFNAVGAAQPSINVGAILQQASMTVDAAANYTFSGTGNIGGAGGLTKTNSGTLTILTTNSYTGPTVIGQGTLEVSSLALSGSPSGIGAANSSATNLVFVGGNLRYLGTSTTTDRNASFNAATAAIDVTNSAATLTAGGTLTGSGALIKTGPGGLALGVANSYAGGTIVTNGTLQLGVSGAAGAAGITNVGTTSLRVGAAFTTLNVLDFTGTCTVDLANVGGDTAFNGAWSGSGTVNVINQQPAARTFTAGGNGSGGGNWANFSGTVNMGTNSGSLRFNDGGGNPNLGSASAVIDLGTGSATMLARNGAITFNVGELRGGPSTKLSGRGSGNAGTLTWSVGGKNTSATFDGNIINGNNSTAIIKTGTGTWTLTGTGSTYTGPTTVNDGTLQVDGNLSGSAVTVVVGTLSGNGTFGSTVVVQAGATLSPGHSIGQMSINTLTLQSGGTNIMEINKAAGTNDSIIGLTAMTYAGTLIVVTNGASPLAAGDSFKLYNATPGNYAGAFDAIDPATPGAGLVWNTSSLTVDGRLKVASLSGPTIASITVSGGNVSLVASNGTPGGQYVVLTTTNLALPISVWTPVVTNNYDGSGAINPPLSIPVNPSATQSFYLLKQ